MDPSVHNHFLTDHAMSAWNYPNLVHGFMGRSGGVSSGPYATLNFSLAWGDRASAVDANWQRLLAALPRHNVVRRLSQVHGALVHAVDVGASQECLTGDGLVTSSDGVLLTILTADCVPILMVDREARVIGALHAGWRGVIGGVIAAGVSSMRSLGARPDHIEAAMGPAIGRCCFEVDMELAQRFVQEIPHSSRHIGRGREGKAHIDLRGVGRDQFVDLGLRAERIITVGPCTCCARERFFSRRGAQGGLTGLQLSFIGLG